MEINNPDINAIGIRQAKEKETVLEHLKKIPIILVACEKAGLSRASFYRWRNEDKEFQKATEEAMTEGTTFINELSESQIISMIKDKNLSAVRFWLRHNDPKYAQKIEISTNVKPQEELDPEQEEVVRKALNLAFIQPPNKDTNQDGKPTE